jgi:hypothetical protein
MLTAGTMILLVFVLVNVVAEALHLQPVLAMFFGHSTVISHSPGKSFVPQIAVSGSNVYVVWIGSGNNYNNKIGTGNSNIFFRSSTDNGTTFGNAINLSHDNNGTSSSPQIAVSGSNVYVVWSDSSTGNGDIYYKKSTDGGDNFGAKKNLSKNAGNSLTPQIAVSGSNVYVVWMDNSPGNYIVYFKWSADGGDNFGAKKNLSNDAGNSRYLQIAVSGSNVYVVWSDNTTRNFVVYLRLSNDNGAKFIAKKNLSKKDGNSLTPQIAVSGSNVYVVWMSSGDGIYFIKSTNNGTTFVSAINLDKDARSADPKIIASGNNVYVVWVHNNNNNNSYGLSSILFRSSTDSGSLFSGIIVNLSNTLSNTKNMHSPQIAESGSNVYVVWEDSANENTIQAVNGGSSSIYFKRISELFFARNG